MNLITLAHKRGLSIPPCNGRDDLLDLPVDDPNNTTIVTFSQTHQCPRSLDARDRLACLPEGNVVLAYADTSPLDALLLWDIAHQMTVGRKLYLLHSERAADLLSRTYYCDRFCEQPKISLSGGMGLRQFVKTAPMFAEVDRGLEAWSFCIPTGPGDPTSLNACVGRILSLGVPQYEILLCGRPRADFLWWSQVRIVGEDIPAPPVHITRKKNVLAQEAQHPNLCILHDRVLLPKNFMEAIHTFGDDYPFTGFQSFWFPDTWQAAARRYSDFCVVQYLPSALTDAKHRPEQAQLPVFEQMGFVMQHPARADFGRDYLCGSLYLCKAKVWAHMPQNEALFWGEYEDVEQGIRAAMAGIPSRINSYALAQTLSCRGIFHMSGAAMGMTMDGRCIMQRSPLEWWGFPRRPTLPLTEHEARCRLAAFSLRYTGDDRLVREAGTLNGLRRYILIARVLWRVRGDMHHLLHNWYREVLCEPWLTAEAEGLQAALNSAQTVEFRKLAWLRHPTLVRQVWNNPFSSPFSDSNVKGLSRHHWRRKVGSLLCSIWLMWGCKQTGFRLSLRALWRLILDDGPEESNGNERT